jgi:hypothetical protein
MKHTCPVCGYPDLEDAPANYEICPSCGTEFGYTDIARAHSELRQRWLDAGAQWYSRVTPKPQNWNPYEQLRRAGFLDIKNKTPDVEPSVSVIDFGVSQRAISSNASITTRLIAFGQSSIKLLGIRRTQS